MTYYTYKFAFPAETFFTIRKHLFTDLNEAFDAAVNWRDICKENGVTIKVSLIKVDQSFIEIASPSP